MCVQEEPIATFPPSPPTATCVPLDTTVWRAPPRSRAVPWGPTSPTWDRTTASAVLLGKCARRWTLPCPWTVWQVCLITVYSRIVWWLALSHLFLLNKLKLVLYLICLVSDEQRINLFTLYQGIKRCSVKSNFIFFLEYLRYLWKWY